MLLQRKRWHPIAITFFFGGVQVKEVTTTCCRCLLFCVRKQDNGNASLFSSMVLLEQKKRW
jgi:hypothetical protein